MKNLKKLSRQQLGELQGAAGANWTGCPRNTTYGNGPNDAPCDAYQMLPLRCKMCVIVSIECMDGGVS